MRNISCLLAVLFIATGILAQSSFAPAHLVNPFIGTGGHGHTFPGATVPFGMVQLSPDTRIDGSWDGCGGYHYSDSLIYGFSHTHLSGVGVSDYGDVMLMPNNKKTAVLPSEYASRFSRKNEKAEAGYYSVLLEKSKIKVELTSSTRAGMHRYTFAPGSERWLLLDNNHRDKLTEGHIEQIDQYTLRGFRRSDAWARDQIVYYYITFSEAIVEADIKLENVKNGRYASPFAQSAWVKFGKSNKALLVKVGISAVDYEGARKNLQSEIKDWNFEKLREEAKTAWNKELSKIEVSGGSKDQQIIFYTALYHCMIHPNIFNDVDGRYRGHDFKIHQAGHNVYTVFSLWDTFRALNPLLTLIDKQRSTDFIRTFLLNYQQGGRLPVWELAANETDCMIGYHSVPVIADAMVKGIWDFDRELAFEAAKKSAMLDHLGLKAYKEKGYIEIEDEPESVSKTVEYAYDDWAISQMALQLNKMDDYWLFKKRAYSWLNLLDPQSKNMRPRSNGGWLAPFEAREVNNHFTEGNSWQYSFFAPQHIPELIKAHGGVKPFGKKLDELFSAPMQTTGRDQADITGLIGQYAHGNEPSHHMAYLYNYIGQPWKTQEHISNIINDFYKNDPDGLIGNEDCGQMSAWLVFSAMGFYPNCPGSTLYALGTPLFDKVVLHTGDENPFTIITKRKSPKDIYLKNATLDTTALQMQFIQHRDFLLSNTLTFEMSDKPQAALGNKSKQEENETALDFFAAPSITANQRVFNDSMKVKISAQMPFYLSINDGTKQIVTKTDTSFYIRNTTQIKATNTLPDSAAMSAKAQYYKRPNNWSVQLNAKYNAQYSAGGDEGLIDGLRGDENWRKGLWQGYQDQDFEAIIDLQQTQNISEIGAGFLQDTRPWILMPKVVSFETSTDGKNWTTAGTVNHNIPADDYTTQIKDFVLKTNSKARYIKIKALKFGNLPEWHAGAGYPAFLFADEVWVR